MEMESGSSAAAASARSPNILKRQRSPSPENVVVILPDESCFDYAPPDIKKTRTEAKNIWTRQQTDALIEEYKENFTELEKPDSTNKIPIWEKIASNINQKLSTNISHENCLLKWRSLRSSYKKVEFSNRTEASKQRWIHYTVLHELLKDSTKEPEPKQRAYSIPTIFNETPTLRANTAPVSGQPTIKIIEPTAVLSTVNPTATQQDLHYPVWFKQFFQVYQKNEETKIGLLAKIKSNLTVMAERQCKALDKLNEHLSKLNSNSS